MTAIPRHSRRGQPTILAYISNNCETISLPAGESLLPLTYHFRPLAPPQHWKNAHPARWCRPSTGTTGILPVAAARQSPLNDAALKNRLTGRDERPASPLKPRGAAARPEGSRNSKCPQTTLKDSSHQARHDAIF